MKMQKTGDVMVFEAGDDWISKCIAKLTDSSVSHAAMVYGSGSMVEMGAHGIVVDQYCADEAGERVHFLRLDPEKSPEPLQKAAQHYLTEKVKFNYADMLLLAGLLIYKSVRPTSRWQKTTDLILKLVCFELDKLLNRLLQKGGKVPAMTCSQLVYQCYLDCGEEYKLVLEKPLLQNSGSNSACIRLSDLIKPGSLELAAPLCKKPAARNQNDLARELYAALNEADGAQHEELLSSGELSTVASSAARLLDLLEKILKQSESILPVYALFVTPCDLLQHTANLHEYDAFRVKRIRQ